MALSREELHQRFLIQAQWTEGLRLYFFELIKDDSVHTILDIGCGTGALLPDLQALSPAMILGADINTYHLQLAKKICPDCDLSGADVHQLPFPDRVFDVVLCHYFLMWTENPTLALQEMHRVTKTGGKVVAFAEPDYGGRIDHPQEFSVIRDNQLRSLSNAGADPLFGRKLKSLLSTSGFSEIECGVYQGSFPSQQSTRQEFETEWMVLANDLSDQMDPGEIEKLRLREQAAREAGTRLIYVPTFYAWGKVQRNH
jgi:ubiquinone/menaquinone biosynthesis C-methylase UbiE